MFRMFVLALLLAGTAVPAAAAAAEPPVDVLAQVQDARKVSTPFGVLVLPPAGSWQLGPVDLTPTKHVVFVWLTGLLVLAVLLPAARVAGRQSATTAPSGGHNLVEGVVLYLRDRVVLPNISHGGERFVPFVLTLFFFILVANLLGLMPFGASVTANISVTAALALLAFLAVEAAGLRALGVRGYLGTIFHRPAGMPPLAGWVVALFLAPVELMGKLARPFALAVRLMANMLGGKLVIYALLALLLAVGSVVLAPMPMVMLVALTLLKIFVAFLQAYIFVLLTSVFIGLIVRAH